MWTPQQDGNATPFLAVEAVNRSSRKVGLRQWDVVQAEAGPLIGGSPFKDRPELLEPDQLHSWSIGPPPQDLDYTEPFWVAVSTTTGKRFRTQKMTIPRTRWIQSEPE